MPGDPVGHRTRDRARDDGLLSPLANLGVVEGRRDLRPYVRDNEPFLGRHGAEQVAGLGGHEARRERGLDLLEPVQALVDGLRAELLERRLEPVRRASGETATSSASSRASSSSRPEQIASLHVRPGSSPFAAGASIRERASARLR